MILYEGPSLLDGSPIVAIATGVTGRSSRNTKTGDMIQTWIIRADVSPMEALRSGQDASICGLCPHRGDASKGRKRSCYVVVGNAPQSVFRAYKRGRYASATDLAAVGKGRNVRLGSYGDPAAVPTAIWQALCSGAAGRTGYTHQWRHCDPALRSLVMASADNPRDFVEAGLKGWRTFRVRSADQPLMPREIVCPASVEAGHKTSCSACKACGGTGAKARVSITIVAHGMSSKGAVSLAVAA